MLISGLGLSSGLGSGLVPGLELALGLTFGLRKGLGPVFKYVMAERYVLVNVNLHHPENGGALALMTCKRGKITHLWSKLTGQKPH